MENLRQKIESKMNEKASSDPDFRKALLQNPAKVIESGLGIAIPTGVRVTVKEGPGSKLSLILATESRGTEVSDELLEKVAGGGTGGGGWGAPSVC